ncbi:hypothetical protein J3A83DRAFT_4196865 [Scleroderma citrinum]
MSIILWQHLTQLPLHPQLCIHHCCLHKAYMSFHPSTTPSPACCTYKTLMQPKPAPSSTVTSSSLTGIIGNIEKMEVMMMHMHKAELITVSLNMSINCLCARGVMTMIQMMKTTMNMITMFTTKDHVFVFMNSAFVDLVKFEFLSYTIMV